MKKTFKFDGSQTGTFSHYERENYSGFKVAIIIVVLMIVFSLAVFSGVIKGHASQDSSVAICRTVTGNQVAAYDGHSVDSLDANTRHCVAESKAEVKKESVKHNNPIVTVDNNTPAVTTVTSKHDNPVVTDDEPSDDKNHCNNGNGNGAEGCNASDKGNQDETSQKGDKAENHPGNGNNNSDNHDNGKGNDNK